MIDILLISDQPRLHAILETTGKLPDGNLRIATSLTQGMEEITSRVPDLLFLQNRLSGLAGYLLVRHVRSEIESASTKIILLTDSAEGGEPSSADIELLTAVSDNELSDAISEIIGDHLPHENSDPVAHEQTIANSAEATPHQPELPEVSDTVSLSRSSGPVPIPAPPPPAPSSMESLGADDDDSGRQATILNSNPPPIQWEKKRLAVAVSISVTLLAVGLLATLMLRTAPKQDAPKKPVASVTNSSVVPVQTAVSSNAPKVAPAPNPPVPLPSFIPPAGIDPAYRISHPGWERYTSAAREYKIFTEAGKLKAIQVIDRQASGIPPAFFSSVIQEMAKVRDYQTVSKEVKGDYLVKKGTLSKTADIILYKNRSDTKLHAFVLYFTRQGNTTAGKGQ